jgi:TRAP-type C4-dicarboxylate transport system substrate-binding protein
VFARCASIAGLCLLTFSLVFLAAPAAAQVTHLRIATNAPEGSPWADGLEALAQLITKNSKGVARMKMFPSGTLGNEQEIMAAVQKGRVDVYGGSAGATHAHLPELAVFELPFLFESYAEVDAVAAKVLPLVEAAVAKHGWRLILFSTVGFRHLGSPRPVRNLAEMRALKMRAQPSPMHERMWASLGVAANPMELPEVSRALDVGTVDSFDSSVVWMFATGWHNQIKHITLTNHIFQPGVGLIGPRGLERIPASVRPLAFEGSRAIGRESIRRVRELEKTLLEQLPKLGIQLESDPRELRDSMRKASLGLRAEWRRGASADGKRLLDAIESTLAKVRGGRGN